MIIIIMYHNNIHILMNRRILSTIDTPCIVVADEVRAAEDDFLLEEPVVPDARPLSTSATTTTPLDMCCAALASTLMPLLPEAAIGCEKHSTIIVHGRGG